LILLVSSGESQLQLSYKLRLTVQKVAYLVVIASDGADLAAEYILLGRQIASVLVPAKAAVCTAGGLLPILLLAGLCC